MREEVPTSGTIMINDYDLTRMTEKEIPYFRRTMGIVFQDFRLIPTMTVYDNVAFAMRVIGAKEESILGRVKYVLSLVGLQDKMKCLPNQISGGEQQRVALARALVNNANTIIADEPTGNIDPRMSYEIIELLNRINETAGTTIIMVTHEHDLVKKFNHRIVVIDHGEIVSDTAAGDKLEYNNERGYNPASVKTTQSTGNTITIETPKRPSAIDDDVAVAAKPEVSFGTLKHTAAAKPVAPQQTQATKQPVATQQPQTAKPAVAQKPAAAPKPAVAPKPAAAQKPQATKPTATATPQQPQKTNPYTTIDGIDYSKYFEDIDELLGKGGSSK